MASPSSVDFKYGFQRPEMYTSPLSGTVDAYDRHVFLCYGTPKSWPSNIEDSQLDPLPRVLSSALKSLKSQIPEKIRLTLCEGEIGGESSKGDILIFPDMIKYRGLTHQDVDGFVDDVFIRHSNWAHKVPENLVGSHIFICSHQNRDLRCGRCGPVLVETFNEEIGLRGMKNEVFITPCSHLGGHQYAGNLIIFGSRLGSECEAHWYGYVTPNDVSRLLDEHIGKGEIVEQLWRGQMSSWDNEEKNLEEKRPKGNNDGNKNRPVCCCSNDPTSCCSNTTTEGDTSGGESNTRKMTITKRLGKL